MASSVDGRTLHSRWRPKGSGGDLFERVHDELAGDAWLVGRVTGQEVAKGKPYSPSTNETFPREPWIARRDASPTFPTGLVFSDFRCLVEAEAESLQGAGH